MSRSGFMRSTIFALLLMFAALTFLQPSPAFAQTVSCAAPPASLSNGPYITVNSDQDHVNVRGGPNSYLYDKVGILYPGESAMAIGRSPGGDWIQIGCAGAPRNVGWVYSSNVTLTSSGLLPVVEPPATPTLPAPPTIDPTLAAEFQPQPTATRLPTFTPAAPVTVPAFADSGLPEVRSGLLAPLITGFGLIGLAGLVASFLLRR